VPDHISRKRTEAGQKSRKTIEHGAEAVILSRDSSRSSSSLLLWWPRFAYGGWRFYVRFARPWKALPPSIKTAMKAYQGRIGAAPDPADPNEPVYPDDPARPPGCFAEVHQGCRQVIPRTNPGKNSRATTSALLSRGPRAPQSGTRRIEEDRRRR